MREVSVFNWYKSISDLELNFYRVKHRSNTYKIKNKNDNLNSIDYEDIYYRIECLLSELNDSTCEEILVIHELNYYKIK